MAEATSKAFKSEQIHSHYENAVTTLFTCYTVPDSLIIVIFERTSRPAILKVLLGAMVVNAVPCQSAS